MNPATPTPPGEEKGEVTALIQTLHETGQRLEELTAGEVDAVANRMGSTFLLRRSQDVLRAAEASRQAAILNALPAYIALVDAEGIITSVNEGWRRFAAANLDRFPGCGIGDNYLATFEVPPAGGTELAKSIAKGIRSVLAGTARNFSIEFPLPSSAEHRWFRLSVTPLDDNHPNGAVVMHMDVTAERQTSDSLLASDLLFRQMSEYMHDVFFLRDAHSDQILYVSPAFEDVWGRSCESVYANPESWGAAIHPDDREAAIEQRQKGLIAGEFNLEFRIVRPDGSIRWIESRGFPIYDETGTMTRITGVAKDITERKEAERRIAYLNRVYAMLSGINTLIVRVRDRDELFREACRIAVEAGGFRMAWIGIVNLELQKIVPVASAGIDDDLLAAVRKAFAVNENALQGATMAARAIREKKPVLSNDSQIDKTLLLGKEHAASGVRSIAVLPLFVSDVPVGVLALYASEIEFFHDEELKLLTDLAGDIAFAINHIEKQERLDYLAYYDSLTGLANRSLFLERVSQYMRSAASGKHKLGLFLIDLERFKNINDSLGRPAGDSLLRQVAEWLTRNVGDVNLLARVGADHFAVVLPEIRADGDVAHLIETTMTAFLEHPFRLNDAVFRIASKIGAALFPDDGTTADVLFENAEAALKKAKAHGDRYLFFTPTMTAAVASKLTLENQLRQALDRGEFLLYYQPKVTLANGRVSGAEALIRWNDPRTGLVPPAQFIPVLEEIGLIYEVGRWALRKAVEDYLRWRATGLAAVPIAVNVSPLQLRHRGFVAEIEQTIGIDPQAAAGLELEITESVIMEDVKHSIASLQAIRAMGVSIAIDDFGTGFSSLSYLSRLPVDTLKIDRSFVLDMTARPEGLALISTIIKLAHSLQLKVVAEGVETEEQSRLLRLLSCNEMQGYLFGKPVPPDIFEATHLVPPPSIARVK